jgi:biopolymer transport protein ExbD
VQDGEEAVFENTTSVPFAQATELFDIDRNGDLRSVTRIEFIDVGTILRVTPQISHEDNILMDVVSEESTFEVVPVRAADLVNDVPETTQNKAETEVMVHDRDTIVIGGLRTSTFTDNVDKVPLLGDIPIFGRLFRSSGKNHDHSELLIFITPTIVDERTQPETVKLAQYDEELAETMRYDRLNDMRKIGALKANGEDVISISIGQRGDLFVEGAMTDLDDLVDRLTDLRTDKTKEVSIRRHPKAPSRLTKRVTDAVDEAGLPYSFDDTTMPFVPRLNELEPELE